MSPQPVLASDATEKSDSPIRPEGHDREESKTDSGQARLRIVKFAALCILIFYSCLRIFHGQGPKMDLFFSDLMSFLLNLLSTAFVAGTAAYVYKVSDIETVRVELRKLYRAVTSARSSSSVCVIAPDCLFEEVKEVVKLIHSGECRPIPDLTPAKKDKKNSRSSVYVLPLMAGTYESFVKPMEGEGWFAGEASRPQRMVIVDRDIKNDEIFNFLKAYENEDWKVLSRSFLKDNEAHLFRNFCVITTESGKKTAYFTYLDKSHSNVFTKGSWTQYRTLNHYYIGRLENQFKYLWNMDDSMPIKQWLEFAGKATVEI